MQCEQSDLLPSDCWHSRQEKRLYVCLRDTKTQVSLFFPLLRIKYYRTLAWTQQFHFMWQINGSSTAAEVTQSTYKDKAIVLLWGSWKAKHFGRCSLWLFVSFVKTSHKSCGYITITVICHHLHLFTFIFLLQLSKQVDVLWSRGQSESFFLQKAIMSMWNNSECKQTVLSDH